VALATTTRESPSRPHRPTVPPRIPLDRIDRGRLVRRAAIAFLALILLLAMLSFLGSRTGTSTASANDYSLTVTYPSITRPGLPVRWEFTVTHAGGFSEPISLATTFDALHLFDTSNLEPEPRSSTASADALIYTFDPPPGDTFRVSLDANAEPGMNEAGPLTTSVLVDGQSVVSVTYRTVVVP
jgi:hypothetical protein